MKNIVNRFIAWRNARKNKKLISVLRKQLLFFGCDTSDMTYDEIEQHVINVARQMSKCGVSAKQAGENLSAMCRGFAVIKTTQHEANARMIIDNAMEFNSTIPVGVGLYLKLGNDKPTLTDDECKSISVDYPYHWTDIREWFK